MNTDLFAVAVGEWLRPGGSPEAEVALCCRVRLARNLAGHRFAARADEAEREEILREIARAATPENLGETLVWHDLRELSPLQRRMLVERHLVSREHAESDLPRAVAFDAGERLSLMALEEDHLRIQAFRGGFALRAALADAFHLEDGLAAHLAFAFDGRFGYLTGCPTNVGTGLRASAMLHLPALSAVGHAEHAFRAVQELRMAVRGLYGEGTQAHGDLYQISNQSTVGRSEEEIAGDLEAVVAGLVKYEREARERLLEKERRRLEDMVWRAWGALSSARLLSSDEAMKHMSMLRLGHGLGWLPSVDTEAWGRRFLRMQPAHLQASAAVAGEVAPEMTETAAVRDGLRADGFRDWLAGKEK